MDYSKIKPQAMHMDQRYKVAAAFGISKKEVLEVELISIFKVVSDPSVVLAAEMLRAVDPNNVVLRVLCDTPAKLHGIYEEMKLEGFVNEPRAEVNMGPYLRALSTLVEDPATAAVFTAAADKRG